MPNYEQECVYRISKAQSAMQFLDTVAGKGGPIGVIAAGGGEICQVALDTEPFSPAPFCVYPNLGTETCPLAKRMKKPELPSP